MAAPGKQGTGYLRLLRISDLKTIRAVHWELFNLEAPDRSSLEEAVSSERWLSLAAITQGAERDQFGGFIMSVVATIADLCSPGHYNALGPRGMAGAEPGEPASAGPALQPSSGSGVLDLDKALEGIAALGLPQDSRAVYVCLLGVLPQFRRQGLATTMMQQVINSARKSGCSAIFLHVRPDNTAALYFYASFGFLPTALAPGYYQQQDEAAAAAVAAGAATAASNGVAAARAPVSDAVLLTLPLTNDAAVRAAMVSEAASALLEARLVPVLNGATEAGSSGTSILSGASSASPAQQPQQAVAGATGASAEARDRSATGNSSGGRASGGNQTNLSASPSGSSSSGGGGGTGSSNSNLLPTIGLAAAAAVGALASTLFGLPFGGRGRGRGPPREPIQKQIEVGGEVMVQVRGADGELYLQAPEAADESSPPGAEQGGAGSGGVAAASAVASAPAAVRDVRSQAWLTSGSGSGGGGVISGGVYRHVVRGAASSIGIGPTLQERRVGAACAAAPVRRPSCLMRAELPRLAGGGSSSGAKASRSRAGLCSAGAVVGHMLHRPSVAAMAAPAATMSACRGLPFKRHGPAAAGGLITGNVQLQRVPAATRQGHAANFGGMVASHMRVL